MTLLTATARPNLDDKLNCQRRHQTGCTIFGR